MLTKRRQNQNPYVCPSAINSTQHRRIFCLVKSVDCCGQAGDDASTKIKLNRGIKVKIPAKKQKAMQSSTFTSIFRWTVPMTVEFELKDM